MRSVVCMMNLTKNHKASLATILAATAATAVVACTPAAGHAAARAASGSPAASNAAASSAAASSAAASSAATASASTVAVARGAGQAHIMVWSVNSDGPDFRAILTGAVGDYGPGVTVHPDGTVDPEHTSELELNMSRGSFRLSIAALASQFRDSVGNWPYNKATCSIHGTVTDPAPIVAGSGTGAYRGITGTFTLTISLDEDYIPGPSCSETSAFKAQLLLISGTGSVRT
jgi:hypothetical protein